MAKEDRIEAPILKIQFNYFIGQCASVTNPLSCQISRITSCLLIAMLNNYAGVCRLNHRKYIITYLVAELFACGYTGW